MEVPELRAEDRGPQGRGERRKWKEKMSWGKNLEKRDMRLRAAQMEHGKSYCGVIGREVDKIAQRIDICWL